MARKIVKIEGMTCEHCVRHVTEALEEVQGLNQVVVNLEQNNALMDAGDVPEEAIKGAVEEAGYTVTGISPA